MVRFTQLLAGCFFFSSQIVFGQVPAVTNFAPTSGPIGTTVTINGINFSATPANNIVYFGATQGTVTAATSTQLTVTVPSGATHQLISVSVGGLTSYSSLPFVVSFSGGGSFNACPFASPVNIGTVAGANRNVLADVDGDGKIDLLVSERTANQLSIFRNTSTNGKPSFAPKISITGLTEAIAVAFGDVDSDGKPDIAVVNYNNNLLSVFKNLSTPGTITLGTKVDFTIPSFSHDVSIADMDGDGKQDLVITSSLNGLGVLRNIGSTGMINSSTFAGIVNFATGSNAYPFRLGDIDGDGKLDAVVPNANTYTVSLLRNTSSSGTVSFAPQVVLTNAAGTPPAGLGTQFAILGDIDGDGKLDLTVTNGTVLTVSLYRNTSSPGSFSFDPKFDINTTGSTNTPALSDLDGDGKIDLVIDEGTAEFGIYKNTATSGSIDASSFQSPVVIPRSASSINLLGDVDGDGRNDVVCSSNNVQVFRNQIGTFSQPTITSFAPTSAPIGSIVTITGTNFSTILANNIVYFGATQAMVNTATSTQLTVTIPHGATYEPISVQVGCLIAYSNNPFIQTFIGSGVVDATTFGVKSDFTTGGRPAKPALGDFDGDGKPDVATINDLAGTVSVLRNISTASNAITFAARQDFPAAASSQGIEVGDMDNDGKLDLIIVSDGSSQVSVFRNTSSVGSISFDPRIPFTTGTLTVDVAIGDLDGDGKTDMVVTNATSSTISVYRNRGITGISFAARQDITTGSNPYSVAIGDIDGDGKSDVLTANRNSNTVSIFRNISSVGSMAFDPRVDLSIGAGTQPHCVAIGDLDGDGKADIVSSNYASRTLSAFRNNSSPGTLSVGSFDSRVDFVNGTVNNPTYVSIGDVNGDGKPDLAVGNDNGTQIQVHKNLSTVGAITPTSFQAKVDFTSGTRPYRVSIGDLNADGKPEIVSANATSNTISVFRNFSYCVSPLEQNALVALYNSARGGTWGRRDNWFSTDVSTWFGITVEGCRVTEIIMGENNLTGTLPPELGNLTELKVLDLNENFITGSVPVQIGNLSKLTLLNLSNNDLSTLPDFSSTPLFGTNVNFQVYNNALDFGDVEPNVGFGFTFNYTNQSPPLPGDVISFNPGQTLTIPFTTPGTANIYQWYKDGVPAGSPSPTSNFVKLNAVAGDVGQFYVVITNSIATDLTLQSEIFNVVADPCVPPGPRVAGNLDFDFDPLITQPTPVSVLGVQSTGKIVASTGPVIILPNIEADGIVRFNPDGSFDGTFANNTYYAKDLIVQPDDKIIAVTVGEQLIRLNEDGSDDTAFGSQGALEIFGIGLQPDGKILWSYSPEGPIILERLNADGTTDNSFLAPADLPANVIKVQPDGKILLAGPFAADIVRLDATGAIDAGFSDWVNGPITDMAIQPDGKIIVVGRFADALGRGIMRLNTDGTPDNTFNPLGISGLPINGYPTKVVLHDDGKILIAGLFEFVNGAARKNIVRLNPDGSIDCGFDPNSSTDNVIVDMALDANQNILIAGSFTEYDSFTRNGLARIHNADGLINIVTGLGDQDATACEGSIVNFTISVTGPPSLAYQWQYSVDGVEPFADIVDGGGYSGVTTETLSINTAGNFGAGRYRCVMTADLATTVFTNEQGLGLVPGLTAPTTTGATICSGSAGTLSASGGTNGQYRWYTSATGNALATELPNSEFVAAALTATTTYFVSIDNGSCESARTAVSATVNPVPSVPTTTDATACSGSTATLNASGGVNGQYRWYDVTAGGTAIAGQTNSAYITPSLSVNTTYHVAINNGSCESARAAVTAVINPVPTSPTATGGTNCSGNTVTLNASGGTNGQYRWYDVATGGTAITGETNATFATPSLTSTTTYYVSIHDGTCESARTPATATVSGVCNQPPVINATAITVQVQGSATISLAPLLSDPDNNLNLSSLRLVTQPTSGALATIDASQNLTLNYSGINFSGTDHLIIEVCDLSGACSQQQLNIDVVGEMITYNAVSPGSDGKNDIFLLEHIDILQTTKDNRVTIFNRWGDVVFDVENYDNANRVFRGLSNDGKELPSGIYYYKIVFGSGAESRDGFISLRR
jgi:uncharacterized delta-60 repeat protein/gliding motility-associated-like protein